MMDRFFSSRATLRNGFIFVILFEVSGCTCAGNDAVVDKINAAIDECIDNKTAQGFSDSDAEKYCSENAMVK